MSEANRTTCTVSTIINAPVEKVWEFWTIPEHITRWNNASEDWHTPWAKNDVRPGGEFSFRMEEKNSGVGFEFGGVYETVKPHELITYTMGDGRKATIHFTKKDAATEIVETFDTEFENPAEVQRGGWQAILDNFKKYVEASD